MEGAGETTFSCFSWALAKAKDVSTRPKATKARSVAIESSRFFSSHGDSRRLVPVAF
jgi:hypothetical protein